MRMWTYRLIFFLLACNNGVAVWRQSYQCISTKSIFQKHHTEENVQLIFCWSIDPFADWFSPPRFSTKPSAYQWPSQIELSYMLLYKSISRPLGCSCRIECSTVPATSGRPHGSLLVGEYQWPSSQPLSSPQLSHNDSFCREVRSPQREMTLNNLMELWGMWSTCWLPLLPVQLWTRLLVLVRVPTMGQIELFNPLYSKPFSCGK